jgi:preprotein translocase subunit SecA
VDRGICGSLESVKKEFEKKHRPFIQKLISTNDYYTEILTTWSRSDIEEYENNEISAKHIQEAVNAPKIGRNDPCPCGSGKKYKKCCLNEGLYE